MLNIQGYCPEQQRDVLPSADKPDEGSENLKIGQIRKEIDKDNNISKQNMSNTYCDAYTRRIKPPRPITGNVKDLLHSSW